jgi:RHS repeat-associated protein
MPGRNFNSNSYRHGFNGMEKDDEVKGNGNSYTTEYRQYDPRLGRWLSIDPAMAKYPEWSPYVFAFDNPIWYHDPKGDDPPTIPEILKEGKKSSTTFSSLLKTNDISETNFSDKLFFSSKGTFTIPKTGVIMITQSENIKFQVIKLTHELTNRKNLKELKANSSDVEQGKITPQEYAKKTAQVEFEGEINQIKVAAEIGYKYEGKGSEGINKLIDRYSKDKTIDLSKELKPNAEQTKFYEAQGQKLRDNYKAKTEDKKE